MIILINNQNSENQIDYRTAKVTGAGEIPKKTKELSMPLGWNWYEVQISERS